MATYREEGTLSSILALEYAAQSLPEGSATRAEALKQATELERKAKDPWYPTFFLSGDVDSLNKTLSGIVGYDVIGQQDSPNVHFDPGASGRVESEQQHQLFDGDVKDSAKELGENIAIGFDYTKYIFAAIVVLLILYIVAKKA
jgi:hypothetical protein